MITTEKVGRRIRIRNHVDERGGLAFLEDDQDVGFPIRRLYYLYGNAENRKRGAHAHKRLKQCMLALAGRVTVRLDNGRTSEEFHLNNPVDGLLVAPMMWRDIYDFSSDAVVLVVASETYDAEDYIHDYEKFRQEVLRTEQESKGL